MDTVCNKERLGFWYAVHPDRASARGGSHNDASVSLHQLEHFKCSLIEKREFMVAWLFALSFRRPIHRMIHDRKVLCDNHHALAVLSGLDDPASQHHLES